MQNMTAQTIKLHDIKPLLEIHEYSFYYLLALVFVGGIIALGLLYLLFKYLHGKKKVNIRQEHLKKIGNLDLKDAKKSAYILTEYGATFKEDSPRHEKTYHDLIDALENYKYKKDVGQFDANTLRIIENYRGMLDV